MFKFSLIIVTLFAFQVFFLGNIKCNPVEKSVQLSDGKIAHIKEIAKKLMATLSPEIDLCQDYFGHVCQKNGTIKDPTPMRIENGKAVESYLEKNDLSEAETKMKNYLKSCQQEQDIKKFVKEFGLSESVGGWPAFNPNWNGGKFDLQTAIAKFASFGISVIIDQEITINPSTVKEFKSVDTQRFNLLNDDEKKKKMKEKLLMAGVEDVGKILSDAEKVEIEYNEVVDAVASKDEGSVHTDIKGLKEKIPEIDWDKQMEIILEIKLENDFPVVIRNLNALKKVIKKVSEMDPKAVVNYLFCHFVHQIPIIKTNNSFETCILNTFATFNDVLAGLFIKNFMQGKEKVMITSMVISLLEKISQYKNVFESFKDLPESFNDILSDDYLSTFSDEELNKEYKNVVIDPDDYLLNTFLLRRHKNRKMFEFENKFDMLRYTITEILSQNFYRTQNEPSSVLYLYISLEMITSYAEFVIRPGSVKGPVVECFENQVDQSDPERRKILANAAVYIQIIVKGYFDWADKNEEIMHAEDELLKEFDFNAKKLLLTTIMQLGCGSKDPQTTKNSAVIFSGVHELSDVFNCPLGSLMNPKEKCSIDKFV